MRPLSTILLLLCLGSAIPGCATPDYFLPSGFSSTYHRHLYGETEFVTANGPESPIGARPATGVFYLESLPEPSIKPQTTATQSPPRESNRFRPFPTPPTRLSKR